jgi:hypothetical protein
MEKYGVMDEYKCQLCKERLELPHNAVVPTHLKVEGEKTSEHIHDFVRVPEEVQHEES